MTLARAIIGTIEGIPRALADADADLEDLYAVSKALFDASNAVQDASLRAFIAENNQRFEHQYSGNREPEE